MKNVAPRARITCAKALFHYNAGAGQPFFMPSGTGPAPAAAGQTTHLPIQRGTMAYQSTNPYDGKVLQTFEQISDAQLEEKLQRAAG